MRKIILSVFILFSISSKSQTVLEVLGALLNQNAKTETTSTSPRIYLKDVIKQTINVNSSSKAWMAGGKTRDAMKIELPKGTSKWYYRVTVLDINSYYDYPENESLFYLVSNNKSVLNYDPTNYGVDFFILGNSGEVNSFLQTGNDNFRVYTKYSKNGIGSFYDSCDLIDDNLWIGIRNPNPAQGLKVIVEVFAFGNFN